MSDEKRDRNPWDDRYDQDEDESESEEKADPSETSKMSKSAETAESEKSTEGEEASGGTVRERKNVNMYLPGDQVSDLQLRYSELNVQWRREYDEDLPKNDQFYPAVIQAALKGTSIEEQLPIGEE